MINICITEDYKVMLQYPDESYFISKYSLNHYWKREIIISIDKNDRITIGSKRTNFNDFEEILSIDALELLMNKRNLEELRETWDEIKIYKCLL